jgi:hypothetical protein
MMQFFESPLGLWIRVLPYLFISVYLIRCGAWPESREPRQWYERTIRVAGGTIFLKHPRLFGGARIMGWVKQLAPSTRSVGHAPSITQGKIRITLSLRYAES